ncbi:hypothetical protein PFICI_07448 [Pestalotiopsis fici W106-1]|uniref:Major facilitator superfamily (MFS) profile domain-containing protein n=1 Tax=Pestalotiopsis fici (strain W106-1 / CGMCC3.15140) TaxID=1229662 RepID=W3X1M8_PESFW|nr:uncharacterized protein PFICI_07448 [Pestalotiopsis fici W106-1]ETS79919.1 hypothetical protein PFICI_07448 [Pestalotiopsis fici W106-1]
MSYANTGEKVDVEKVEDCHDASADKHSAPARAVDAFTPNEIKRVVRKLDFRLMPLCFILYTFSVLDRSNLGNAKLAGLEDDINLSGKRYQWLGTAFYIAYIIFQFTTLGWKLFPPHRWVALVVFFWGTASTLQAVCTSWAGLMACRFMLGIAETMFGPGVPLYMSFFYPREYMGVRFGIFLSGAALANAYGGALAYGLSHVHSSVSNWRFLFIIEGVPTALLAIVCWFHLPDSPNKAKSLSFEEKRIAQALATSQPGEEAPSEGGLHWNHLADAFKDYRNWLFAISNFSTNVSFASLPLFLPTIISEMGTFDTLTANGLSAPPYALAFLAIIGCAFLSDYLRTRGPIAVFFALVASAGYLILALSDGAAPRYVGIFLVVLIFVTVSTVLVWNVNTNESGSKRAGGLWIIMTVGQCGTLLGTNMFPSNEAPYYRRGMWIGFAFSMLSACVCGLLSFVLWRENRRRDRLHGSGEGVSDDNQDVRETVVRYII